MEVHAELYSLVENALGIVRVVDVVGVLRLHPLVIVIDNSLNDSVSDGFGHDLLGFFNVFYAKLLFDVLDGDLRITDVDFLKSELDDSVSQPLNQDVVLVLLEQSLMDLQNLFEVLHITRLNACYHLIVRSKCLLEIRVREYLPIWDLSHEEFSKNLKFLHLSSESLCAYLRAFSQSLNKSSLRFGILKLYSFNPAQVVKIPCILVVRSCLWERSLNNEVSRLLVQVLRQVRS